MIDAIFQKYFSLRRGKGKFFTTEGIREGYELGTKGKGTGLERFVWHQLHDMKREQSGRCSRKPACRDICLIGLTAVA